VSAARGCDHGLRWGAILVECDGIDDADGGDGQHGGVYMATRLVWHEGDRRDFVGDDPGPCPVIEGVARCVLPAQHRGDHAF
jgi:hypothetical protein